jgi:hypothetical protein
MKLVPKIKRKGKEEYIARYNLDIDSEVEGVIHHNAEVSTTAKWIFNAEVSTHMTPDTGLSEDIWPF